MDEAEIAKKLFEATIREYCSVTNRDLIIRYANEVDGVDVNEYCVLQVPITIKIYVRFIERIKQTFGPVAYMFARQAIKDIVTDEIKYKLPEEIR